MKPSLPSTAQPTSPHHPPKARPPTGQGGNVFSTSAHSRARGRSHWALQRTDADRYQPHCPLTLRWLGHRTRPIPSAPLQTMAVAGPHRMQLRLAGRAIVQLGGRRHPACPTAQRAPCLGRPHGPPTPRAGGNASVFIPTPYLFPRNVGALGCGLGGMCGKREMRGNLTNRRDLCTRREARTY